MNIRSAGLRTAAGPRFKTCVPLYARAGITEVWLVDLGTDSVEVLREPTAAGYADTRVLRRGQRIIPQTFPDLRLTVDELLG